MPRIIVVDDEPLIRNGLARMIERVAPEWEVSLEADNGVEALELIISNPIDLLFSDIRMPKMDGLELMENLSEMGYPLPIIFLTGYEDFQYVQKALRHDAFDYLLKPIQEQQLRHVLDRYMQERFIPVGQNINNADQSRIDRFEFDLNNALESYDKHRLMKVLAECEFISPDSPATMILNHAIRIINGFFTKKGIYGLDYVPKAIPGQMTVLLETIARKTCELLDRIGGQEDLSGSDRLIEKAQAYIKNNIDKPLTLAMVAEHIHFNPTYFSEYFRLRTGETFSRYYIRLRVEEAKKRLQHTDYKINEIAEQCGYQDPHYFSKMFKLIVGITPKEYRSNIHNDH